MMKKMLFSLIFCIILQCSCTVITPDPTATAPPCDNTVSDCNLTLDWSGTSYLCTASPYGTAPKPPLATGFNYLGAVSANAAIGSLSSSYSYLCQIISKNNEPAANPNLPCSNPGSMTFTWAIAGGSQNIKVYKNANTDITVDYYDVCGICNDVISQGRPYFSGKIIVPPGATSTQVNLQTQAVYVGTKDKPCE